MFRTLKHTLIVLLILATCWVFIPFAIAFIAWASGGRGHVGDSKFSLVGGLCVILFIASGPVAARAYLKWASKQEARAQDWETQERLGVQRLEKEIKKSKPPVKD